MSCGGLRGSIRLSEGHDLNRRASLPLGGSKAYSSNKRLAESRFDNSEYLLCQNIRQTRNEPCAHSLLAQGAGLGPNDTSQAGRMCPCHASIPPKRSSKKEAGTTFPLFHSPSVPLPGSVFPVRHILYQKHKYPPALLFLGKRNMPELRIRGGRAASAIRSNTSWRDVPH